MAKTANRIFTLLVGGLTVLAMLSLAFVIWFVAKEALPLFQEVSPAAFFLGSRWMPVDFGNGMSFGIFNFIMGTLAVSLSVQNKQHALHCDPGIHLPVKQSEQHDTDSAYRETVSYRYEPYIFFETYRTDNEGSNKKNYEW